MIVREPLLLLQEIVSSTKKIFYYEMSPSPFFTLSSLSFIIIFEFRKKTSDSDLEHHHHGEVRDLLAACW